MTVRQDRRSKRNVVLYIFGVIPVVWLGLLIAPCMKDGLLGLVRQFGSRSMQKLGVLYPYWENAARCIEDWCSLLLFLCLLLSVLPIACGLVLLQRMLRRGKEKLEDDLLPEWKDQAEEAIRVQQRRRWEKKHGEHEK